MLTRDLFGNDDKLALFQIKHYNYICNISIILNMMGLVICLQCNCKCKKNVTAKNHINFYVHH